MERIAPRDKARWEEREAIPSPGGMLQVSTTRAGQVWMVVGMLDRMVGRGDLPGSASRSAAGLFTRPMLRGFWELAVAGELRARPEDVGKPMPLATQRIVRDVLAILADLVVPERPVWLPVVEQPELKPVVSARDRAALYRGLADMAAVGPLVHREGYGMPVAARARVLAMVGIVLDAGTRLGELAALRLDDLAPGLAAVGVRRRPQRALVDRTLEIAALAEVHPSRVTDVLTQSPGRRVAEATRQRVLAAVAELEPLPDVEWYALSEGTRAAVGRWLREREQVVEALPLEGGRSGVWVTLRATKAGPPGVTLLPGGLQQAYGKGVTALNMLMAGQYGWSPLPTRMEQLRRAVEAEPLSEEAVRDLFAG
ncbi:helix-turn-helix domain-containing protein [Streptomyces cinereoruber]|uniref:hypothetical protein n=1 Tax=Streptomyces cinereoruber TaxID=67260 RepID=UPI0036290D12